VGGVKPNPVPKLIEETWICIFKSKKECSKSMLNLFMMVVGRKNYPLEKD